MPPATLTQWPRTKEEWWKMPRIFVPQYSRPKEDRTKMPLPFARASPDSNGVFISFPWSWLMALTKSSQVRPSSNVSGISASSRRCAWPSGVGAASSRSSKWGSRSRQRRPSRTRGSESLSRCSLVGSSPASCLRLASASASASKPSRWEAFSSAGLRRASTASSRGVASSLQGSGGNGSVTGVPSTCQTKRPVSGSMRTRKFGCSSRPK
mmetsp:Transcript_81777/g.243900  ORF Transcript_81777/g.243900 Transcript_81777/m.243900 type:complete len:210 (+) Transcript_81777:363-992(+)